jgi:hypothetical protein
MGVLSNLRMFQKRRADRRYAVEVSSDFSGSLSIEGAKIVESWESSDNTVTIIFESNFDLCARARELPGVRDIRKM